MRTIIVIFTERKLSLNKVCNTCFCTNIPANEAEKYNTLTPSSSMALGRKPQTIQDISLAISMLDTVQYAGVVYFRNQEDAIKAVKILGKRVKSLFD